MTSKQSESVNLNACRRHPSPDNLIDGASLTMIQAPTAYHFLKHFSNIKMLNLAAIVLSSFPFVPHAPVNLV